MQDQSPGYGEPTLCYLLASIPPCAQGTIVYWWLHHHPYKRTSDWTSRNGDSRNSWLTVDSGRGKVARQHQLQAAGDGVILWGCSLQGGTLQVQVSLKIPLQGLLYGIYTVQALTPGVVPQLQHCDALLLHMAACQLKLWSPYYTGFAFKAITVQAHGAWSIIYLLLLLLLLLLSLFIIIIIIIIVIVILVTIIVVIVIIIIITMIIMHKHSCSSKQLWHTPSAETELSSNHNASESWL